MHTRASNEAHACMNVHALPTPCMNVGSNLDLETRERPSRASRPYVGTRDILFLFGEEGNERDVHD
jgi:hypothetical protein